MRANLLGENCYYYIKKIMVSELGSACFPGSFEKKLGDLWFLCCCCLSLSCLNSDWFLNRGQQQINEVDPIFHRKQHFRP